MTLFKTSFWMGILTLLKAICTYVMWKIIAVRVGPSGIALIEQFQNFIQVSRVSVPSGINEGVVKYTSEHREDFLKKSDILSNAMWVNSIICFVSCAALIIFSKDFSMLIFKSAHYQKMIILVAAGVFLFMLNSFGMSILNAEMEIKKYTLCSTVNIVFNFITTTSLVVFFGLTGGLIGFAVNQTVTALFVIYLVTRAKWFRITFFFSKMNLVASKKLITYSLIPLSAALIGPIAGLITINYVAHMLTWTGAGYWQSIMRLSEGYITLMAMLFGFYFLPKYSSIKKIDDLKREVVKSHYTIMPLIFFTASMVFLFKKEIVLMMFSKAFLPIIPLFKYQLIGDVSRSSTWLLKNILAARAMVKTCISMEVIFTSFYVILTISFVHIT